MKIRCSALGKIMTRPRSKSEFLSQTAKSYIRDIAKQDFYGYETELKNKYLDKGIQVENDSIQLYNSVFFTDHIKNTERITNDFLTGEADIVGDDIIIDIKSSFSLETFPALPEDADVKDYQHQVRGYMMLYNKQSAQVAFCMSSTPDELLNEWDNWDIHKVEHIAPEHRVTIVSFERSKEWEQECEERCKASIEYYTEYINLLNNKNK